MFEFRTRRPMCQAVEGTSHRRPGNEKIILDIYKRAGTFKKGIQDCCQLPGPNMTNGALPKPWGPLKLVQRVVSYMGYISYI